METAAITTRHRGHFLLFLFAFLSYLPSLFAAGDILPVDEFRRRGIPGDQPLSQIAIHKASIELDGSAHVHASPLLLGRKGEDTQWVNVHIRSPNASVDDWIGVFSPAKFNWSSCPDNTGIDRVQAPQICSAPIKYQFANYESPSYTKTGNASLRLQLINQRADFSFALFSGGLANPKLVAVSNAVLFVNPKAPVYPRLAQGKAWNEMTVTWTSGYDIVEAYPFVEWGEVGGPQTRSPAGTLTFNRESMCGAPARTVGWRDPGFIHTAFLKELWPNAMYTYKLGHRLMNGRYVWSKLYSFRGSPYPGQNSLQRVIVFGDMGKNQCVNNEKSNYSGTMNGTIHVVVGGGGSHLSNFSNVQTSWSLHRDQDYGFVKLTAFNHSSLLFEYKKSSDGNVYDSFTITRDYRDVLACVHDSCASTTLAM